MIGEGDIAVLAFRRVAAAAAFGHGRESAAVYKHYGLSAVGCGIGHCTRGVGRQRHFDLAAKPGAFHVDDVHFRENRHAVAFCKFNKPEASGCGLVICFDRRGGASQKSLGAMHSGKYHRGVAGVVARCRILLFIACFVFFVDDHKTERIKAAAPKSGRRSPRTVRRSRAGVSRCLRARCR